jgi:PAS domain-containing protein
MEHAAGRLLTGYRSVANVVAETALTGAAFVVLNHFGLVGDWPLPVLLAILAGSAILSEAGIRALPAEASGLGLHAAVGTEILAVTVITYAIGWGPTLAIGYVFVLARMTDVVGARVWRPAIAWTIVGIALGQAAIALGLVSSYLSASYVQGLGVLSALGVAFVMAILGRRTEENEDALAALDESGREVRSTVSVLSATLDATADGILVVDATGAISHYNRQFVEMWRLPQTIIEQRDDALALQCVIDQLEHPDLFLAKVEELYAQPESTSDDTLLFKDGRVVERHSCPHRVDGTIAGRVWSFRDITERQQLVDELAHQAFHDSLTGLANLSLR